VWNDFTAVSSASSNNVSSLAAEVYVNGSTESANYLTGSPTYTGNVLTLPEITFPTGSGGVTVVVECGVLANSQTWKTAIVYRVLKPGAAR
jgi:hypothetical protein